MNVLEKNIQNLIVQYEGFENVNLNRFYFLGASDLVYGRDYSHLINLLNGAKSKDNIVKIINNTIIKEGDNILYYIIPNSEGIDYLFLIEDKEELWESNKVLFIKPLIAEA